MAPSLVRSCWSLPLSHPLATELTPTGQGFYYRLSSPLAAGARGWAARPRDPHRTWCRSPPGAAQGCPGQRFPWPGLAPCRPQFPSSGCTADEIAKPSGASHCVTFSQWLGEPGCGGGQGLLLGVQGARASTVHRPELPERPPASKHPEPAAQLAGTFRAPSWVMTGLHTTILSRRERYGTILSSSAPSGTNG